MVTRSYCYHSGSCTPNYVKLETYRGMGSCTHLVRKKSGGVRTKHHRRGIGSRPTLPWCAASITYPTLHVYVSLLYEVCYGFRFFLRFVIFGDQLKNYTEWSFRKCFWIGSGQTILTRRSLVSDFLRRMTFDDIFIILNRESWMGMIKETNWIFRRAPAKLIGIKWISNWKIW